MPRVDYVEKTIFAAEEVNVDFYQNGRNVRDEVQLPSNYQSGRKTKNSATVAFLIDKLKGQYPGYDFQVYDGNGDTARGNMLLGHLRDTY